MPRAPTWILSFVMMFCGLATTLGSTKEADLPLNLTPLDIGVSCGQYPQTPTVLTFRVDQPGADVLFLHFDSLKLKPHDSLNVIAVTNHSVGAVVDTITSTTSAPYFSAPLFAASTVVLELHVKGASVDSTAECFGFHVDGVRTSNAEKTPLSESVCGTDESRNAQCFVGTSMYNASKAVVRLLTRRRFGSQFCTGWLVGCEGHLITNEHCIQNAIEAANTTVEFMAEGASCLSNCTFQGACKAVPRKVARGATLVAASTDLDYALVKLNISAIPPGLGYLQLRASGPKLNEPVYIAHHPRGWGKQVAALHGNSTGTITTLTLPGCAPNQAGYMLDTQPGSSGSPVISALDNTVVALHHCGGCPNAGIQSQFIIQDMIKRGILPRCSIA